VKTVYHYRIDLNERGQFRAHVEHSKTGKIIFELDNEDEDGNCGPLWIVEDGFMEDVKDMPGLGFYLFDLGLIGQNDPIIYKG